MTGPALFIAVMEHRHLKSRIEDGEYVHVNEIMDYCMERHDEIREEYEPYEPGDGLDPDLWLLKDSSEKDGQMMAFLETAKHFGERVFEDTETPVNSNRSGEVDE